MTAAEISNLLYTSYFSLAEFRTNIKVTVVHYNSQGAQVTYQDNDATRALIAKTVVTVTVLKAFLYKHTGSLEV